MSEEARMFSKTLNGFEAAVRRTAFAEAAIMVSQSGAHTMREGGGEYGEGWVAACKCLAEKLLEKAARQSEETR